MLLIQNGGRNGISTCLGRWAETGSFLDGHEEDVRAPGHAHEDVWFRRVESHGCRTETDRVSAGTNCSCRLLAFY